ncbi:MAG: hypothetical protein ACRYGG_07645 [Janthinobacterium lividum]
MSYKIDVPVEVRKEIVYNLLSHIGEWFGDENLSDAKKRDMFNVLVTVANSVGTGVLSYTDWGFSANAGPLMKSLKSTNPSLHFQLTPFFYSTPSKEDLDEY